jgi:hypothetical protein
MVFIITIYKGQELVLLALMIAILFIIYSLRHPMPAVFLSMLVGTQFFQMIPLENMPGIRLPGAFFNMSDLFVLLLLLIAAYRLPKRRERPLFGNFVLIWVIYVAARFALNLLIGEADLHIGLNMIRTEVGWLSYLGFIAVIETPKDLRKYMNFIVIIMLIATGFQIIEAVQGKRLNLFGLGSNEYFTKTLYINVGGQSIPYLWSRALPETLVALFVSLGCAMESVRVRRYVPLAALGVLAVLLGGVRSWFFGLGAGLAVILLLYRRSLRASFRAGLFLLCLVATVAVLAPFMSRSYGNSPWDVWKTRAGQLLHFSEQANFQARVAQGEKASQVIRESPLLGYGWGKTYLEFQTETGINVLLLHGIIGTALILGMYLAVGRRVFRLWSQLPPSEERGYIAGVLALLVLYLAVLFSMDTLNNGGFAIVAAGFVDRITYFHEAGLVA